MECGEMNYVTFHITPATGRGKEDRKTILLEQGRETIRGLLYLTSAKKRGGGLRNTPNLRTNSIDFVDRGGRGTRYPKIMWTSYTGAP